MSFTDNVSNEARGVKGLGGSLRSPLRWAKGETPRDLLDRARRGFALRSSPFATPTLGVVIVPVLLPLVLGVAGWFAADWAGAIAAFGVGLLIDVAVVAGAALWARQIGALMEPEDAWTTAPRPPGYRRLVEWVYKRTLR